MDECVVAIALPSCVLDDQNYHSLEVEYYQQLEV
jgi:hypothetical protein